MTDGIWAVQGHAKSGTVTMVGQAEQREKNREVVQQTQLLHQYSILIPGQNGSRK